jgi:Carbohydrate binding domain
VPRLFSVCVPLVYALLPHYSTNRFWIAGSHINVSMALYFLSLYSDVRAMGTRGRRLWYWKLLNLIALIGSVMAYEVVAPLFLFNVPLVWYWTRQTHKTISAKRRVNIIAVLLQSINVLGLVLTGVYKVTVTDRLTIRVDYWSHLSKLIEGATRINYWEYGVELPLIVGRILRDYFDVTLLTISVSFGLIVFGYLHRILRGPTSQTYTPWTWAKVIAVGLVVFASGYGVFAITDQVGFSTTGLNNRSAIAASVGIAVSFIGGIGWLSSLQPSKLLFTSVFCFLVTLLCTFGFLINNTIAKFWILASHNQQEVVAKIREHFPYLAPGTTLILDGVCPYVGPGVVFETYWDVGGMLQILYGDSTLKGDIVKDKIEIKEEGLRTTIYEEKFLYPYSKKLLIYHVGRNKAIQLTDADTARRYFYDSLKGVDIRETTWQLILHEKNVARLILPGSSEIIQIAFDRVRTKTPWHIQLTQPQLALKSSHEYSVDFLARADHPRHISLSVSMGHEPWYNLGLYSDLDLAPNWQHFEFKFVATGDDENARIQFDLGGSDVAVEFSAVRLWSLSDGTSVEPDFLKTYFSSDYRRNCPRGQEGFGTEIF